MASNYTFVTLLSTYSYLPGVKILYRSLKKNGRTKYPFLCVCSKGLPQECIKELEAEGIMCKRLESSALEHIDRPLHNTCEHWNYTFDKLLIWGLTEYDKIVFLDSDMMIVNPIDELFEKEDKSAVIDEPFNNPVHSLNSGIMVIKPDMAFMKTLIDAIPKVIALKEGSDIGIGDQDVVQYCLPNWMATEHLHLPKTYNLFFPRVMKYVKECGFADNAKDEDKRIRVIHFVFSNKPWLVSAKQFMRTLLSLLHTCNWHGVKFILLSKMFQYNLLRP